MSDNEIKDFVCKVPAESSSYAAHSAFVVERVSAVMKDALDKRRSRIFIHTNLKRGLPLENINKVAQGSDNYREAKNLPD